MRTGRVAADVGIGLAAGLAVDGPHHLPDAVATGAAYSRLSRDM